jgi:hypothetical protein
VVSGRSWGRGATQHIEENAADRVAHLVFLRRCAPSGLKQIRNFLFSDLSIGGKQLRLHLIKICSRQHHNIKTANDVDICNDIE